MLHGADLVVGQGEDGDGLSVTGHEFHLKRIAVGIPVDDGPNVAALQAVILDIVQQNHRVQLLRR